MDRENQATDASLEAFDRALGEWIEVQEPAAMAIAESVNRKLRWLRWLRILIPVLALIIALALFAPMLLKLATGVTGIVAIDWSLMTDIDVLVGSLRQIPAIVWVLLAVTLTVMGVGLSER